MTGLSPVLDRGRVVPAVGLLFAFVAGSAAVPATHAAGPNPLRTVLTALARASAYRVTYSASSPQTPPAIEKRTLVLVRRGSSFQVHMLDAMRPSGAGETTVVEDVAADATVCERVAFNSPLPLTGKFACSDHAGRAAALAVLAEPVYGLIGEGAQVTFAAAASRSMGGRHCAGYTFSAHAGSAPSTGTLYISPSGFPCEQDARTFGPAIGPTDGKSMATITSVTTWSHANDPHLAVPAGVLPQNAGAGGFSVQPAAVRIGQVVTLSGQTRGGELFVPPFVQMASARVHTVSRTTLAQCGGTAPEPVAFGQVAPNGPYAAKGAPAGKAWRISFRIPAQLSTYPGAGGGNNAHIATPPGLYRLVAGFGPAFFCPSALLTAHDAFALAGWVTVLP